ncbi:2-hydroxychromene-2-carboxylate isomerase [Roseibium hamelinense]|uniref:2-hydroxychromene-2-carboxylate isomerase n=1 Tax=Roseibium hamelinense TaxID=150831 RepID=A0A562SLP0_9HYPH|nr:2-hydroxychromene-2-carboxylate isomerase [Roseibium hamelinense]MTI43417.1 2-hydroxychromene-2-carboxylate isomerase [Roseibium hamelinense]TWI81874.1 2-hydroxychromene-2-carboxylate isomerase [Roseibium hamelinense]
MHHRPKLAIPHLPTTSAFRATLPAKPKLQFWFDFASTYSYLSAMCIDRIAKDRQVTIVWRPFLLGPIFKRQGWTTSPFNIYPAKGRYMWQDMARQCEKLNLPLCVPDPFPQNSLLVTRIAHDNREEPWLPAFVQSVFSAEFAQGKDISDPMVLSSLLAGAGAEDPALHLRRAETDGLKMSLRRTVEEAEYRGIFGAPSFVTEGGALFWGHDRLEDAINEALMLPG